ncbi:MAG TPA: DUF255 domain-containing protein [Candidatus Binatia bacterium]|nr:DUF255 domain-containing protein [Candidatus Binatia bacterium]
MIRFSPLPNRAHIIPWREWDEAAFSQARAEDKPVMLFLGAFWCRFCQRMDEGAFSDTEVIALLNAYFIPLRVEYMQRPDVDARYNLNGWPTIAFMAPGGQLLGAVNYLPADQFKELLIDVYMSYEQRKDELRAAVQSPEESQSTELQPADAQLKANLAEIAQSVMALADRTHGGYDRGQKFIHPQVNDFLLERYEATNDQQYLDQVCLTLERMRTGELYDHQGGAYFRTSSNPDWSHPHREKLLIEEAGLLINCLTLFRMTQRADHRRMAEEIIEYLDAKLYDPASEVFFGCEDWLRHEPPIPGGDEFFTIIDRCIYTDANAVVSAAYIDAARELNQPHYRDRALGVLEFLWQHCRADTGGMFHYYDSAPHVPGLLIDQAQMGMALVGAYEATGEDRYLQRAKQLAEFILAQLKNSCGGFYDIPGQDAAALRVRLSLIEQNGSAASFFLRLARTGKDDRYRVAARHSLSAFVGDFGQYGVDAAPFGRALGQFLRSP